MFHDVEEMWNSRDNYRIINFTQCELQSYPDIHRRNSSRAF
jgi:hypothetical protein